MGKQCINFSVSISKIAVCLRLITLQTHGGPAFRDGTMRVNDRIRCVNGVELRRMKLPELQSLLYRQVRVRREPKKQL